MNGTTGARLDDIEGWDQTCDNSANSFSLGSFDLGAISSKRFEWSENESGHRSCCEHMSFKNLKQLEM